MVKKVDCFALDYLSLIGYGSSAIGSISKWKVPMESWDCASPLTTKNWKKVENFAKIRFFNRFSRLDMAIFRAKICSTWPKMVLVAPPARYFDALICFHRCTDPLTTKNWKKVEKYAKIWFFRLHLQALVRLRGAKIWSKGRILVLFGFWEGFWNMPTCFQMFVRVF